MSQPRAEACKHCENYHATRDGLCGNCHMLTPEKRAAQTQFKKQINENKRQADAAAKKAYLDALRDQAAAAAAATTGESDSSANKSESRKLSLGQ